MEKGIERIFKTADFTVYHQNFPKKQLQEHEHNECHLIIPLEGKVELLTEGNTYRFGPGHMIYINKKVKHSFSGLGEMGERIILQFESTKALKKVLSDVVVIPTHPLVKSLIMDLFIYEGEPYIEELKKLLLTVLSYALIDQTNAANNILFTTNQRIIQSTNEQFAQLIKIMQDDLFLDMNDLAKETFMSTKTLNRLIKTEVKLSPKELYTYFRIQKACDLIFKGELNLTGIAFECGYSSLSQFILNFKKWTGQKPSAFNKKN